jgi:hypothetical protein
MLAVAALYRQSQDKAIQRYILPGICRLIQITGDEILQGKYLSDKSVLLLVSIAAIARNWLLVMSTARSHALGCW